MLTHPLAPTVSKTTECNTRLFPIANFRRNAHRCFSMPNSRLDGQVTNHIFYNLIKANELPRQEGLIITDAMRLFLTC